MKIKKIANSVGLVGNVTNEYSESKQDSYSCDFVNGFHGEVLWTNSDPTSGISSGTTISLSSADYDILKVVWKRSTKQNFIYTYETLKGSDIEFYCNSTQGDNVPWVRSRALKYVDDTTYTVDTCYLQFCNSTSRSTETTGCVPIYIVGYKTGLFE